MNTIKLKSFDDFLQIAREQDEPQQLLFVFTRNELPDGHTPTQAASYHAGTGGHLAPVAYVDKTIDEVGSFSALAEEADENLQDWAVFFVAALPGVADQGPSSLAIDQALESMVEHVRIGEVQTYLAFDHAGAPLHSLATH